MLEKFQKMLEILKSKQQQDKLIPVDNKTLEEYFKMEDMNKFLKFNAISKEQLENTQRFEQQLEKVFAKLSVPTNI